MIAIYNVLDDRKGEIEFYYSVMEDIDRDSDNMLHTADKQRFFRIMKSNFLLMLYNLVEATFTTGMLEIYDQVKADGCPYANVIDEIQNIWRDYKVKEVHKPDSKLSTYTNRVQNIVLDITQNTPLILSKSMIGVDGNLNAEKIKKICDKHKIRYRVVDDQLALEKVRKKTERIGTWRREL